MNQRKKSNLLSRLFRPLFENRRRMSMIIGTQLSAAAVFVGSLGPIGGDVFPAQVEITTLSQETIKVLTETTYRFPVPNQKGLSQGFHSGHPGIDIRAERGSDIYAVANGTVIEVEMGVFGYGHKVVIQHENGLTTLYGHMDNVYVKQDQEVTKETVVGKIGMTGWTTGPHLHFEIHTDKGAIDPKQLLPAI